MLLKEYLHSMGIVGFGAQSEEASSLRIIGRFEISGTHYDVVMLSGARVEFPDLISLLACVHAEFKHAPTYDFDLMIDRGSILVTPKSTMGRPWGRNLDKLVENLTLWVSEFNLTGEWSREVRTLATPKRKWETF